MEPVEMRPVIDPYRVDILMVGAGPVGLWTAVQTKILNPALDVLLLDKYEDYNRIQPLKLDSKSFKKIPVHERLASVCAEWTKASFVMTNQIERDLKGIASELGIGFQVEHVKEPASLMERYPNVSVIVGCDGYHSVVREQIFGGEFFENIPLQHIVQVRYSVKGNAKKAGLIKGTAVGTVSGTFVNEHLSKPLEDGSLQITGRFFVDEDAYNAISSARAKEPWLLSDERVPGGLRQQIGSWMAARRAAGLEHWKDENPPEVELTGIQLSAYRSQGIVKMDELNNRVTWVLAGDSLSGVPFFRSLAKGFQEGTRLARCMAVALEQLSRENSLNYFKDYEVFASSLYNKESNLAKSKASWLKTVRLGLWLGRICTPEFGLRIYAWVTLRLHPHEWDPRGEGFPVHPADRVLDYLKSKDEDVGDDDVETLVIE